MSLQMEYLVQKEKYQDLIREAEQDRWLQIAKQQKMGQRSLHRNVASWMGVQMIKWGSKLQHYGSISSATAQTEYSSN